VHPDEETVFALRAGGRLQLLKGDAVVDADDVLPGFPLTVQDLFESVNWDWLDEPPEIEPESTTSTADAQADDATASERSDA
jgi:hypothetical protein